MNENEITRLKVPRWTETPDGGWSRVWTVSLDQPLAADATVLVDRMSTPGLLVRSQARADDPCGLELETRIAQDPLSDENFYYSAYRLFRRIHEEVGALKTIQGMPKELWAPFRAGRNSVVPE